MRNRSTAEGPANIIRDGLVAYVDAGNDRSYYGSTTGWRDISIGSRNATLINTPTYTTEYGGGYTFVSGSDNPSSPLQQRFTIPYFNITTQPWAVEVWFKPSVNASYLRGIVSAGDTWNTHTVIQPGPPGWCLGYGGNGGTTIAFGASEATAVYRVGGPTLTVGQVYNLFMHRNTNDQKIYLYVNGVRWGTSASIPNTVSLTGNYTTIGSRVWQAGPGPSGPQGTMYSIKVYDGINYTDDDVLQNYNALKYRFGL